MTIFHLSPRIIFPGIAMPMPNCFATLLYESPLRQATRIARTRLGVNFLARLGLIAAQYLPARAECLMFSSCVDHSRLVARLFDLSKSLWLTSGKLSGLAMKCCATKRCTLTRIKAPERYNCTARPSWCSRNGFSIRSRFLSGAPLECLTILARLRTRPKSDISYIPSYPSIGFQTSVMAATLS